MKRRLLLVESNEGDQRWMVEQLKSRFRSFDITCAPTIDEAHKAIADYGCDIIITDLKLIDGDTPSAVVHAIMAYAPGVPVIALTSLDRDDESLLDVLTIGVRHILYKEDLLKDYSKLVAVIVDTVRELTSRDNTRDSTNARVQAMSQKLWDVDNRVGMIETAATGLTASITELTKVIDKRGGLEDRVKELEESRSLAIKVMIGTIGLIGTILSAVGAAVVGLYKK